MAPAPLDDPNSLDKDRPDGRMTLFSCFLLSMLDSFQDPFNHSSRNRCCSLNVKGLLSWRRVFLPKTLRGCG